LRALELRALEFLTLKITRGSSDIYHFSQGCNDLLQGGEYLLAFGGFEIAQIQFVASALDRFVKAVKFAFSKVICVDFGFYLRKGGGRRNRALHLIWH